MSKSIEIGHRGICVYCGDKADSVDHLIPISSSIWSGIKRKHKHITDAGPIANACRDCNSRLSDRWFDDFWERMEWSHSNIDKRAGTIDFHKKELDQFDYTLRTLIEKRRNVAIWMRQRADWFGCREFFLNLEPLIWQVEKDSKLERMFGLTVAKTKWELYLRKFE